MLSDVDRRQFLSLGGVALAGFLAARTRGTAAGTMVMEDELNRLIARFDLESERTRPIGERMDRVGDALMGTPYVAHTLETSDSDETCTIDLKGLDCVTYFETCLGIARMVALNQRTMAELVRQITLTRYRGGRLEGYLSRLHYTCEWISDNVQKGVVEDVTPSLPGSEPFVKPINFMSTHPESYRQLKANPDWVPRIAEIEKRITASAKHHVPKAKIADAEPFLRTGDIVGITTSIDGIDCSHTGLCHRDASGELRFRHASSSLKKVVLGPRLSEYVASVSRNVGVMIERPLEPADR